MDRYIEYRMESNCTFLSDRFEENLIEQELEEQDKSQIITNQLNQRQKEEYYGKIFEQL